MLGIGCPDRHALPRFTSSKRTNPDSCSLPRERVRSSTLLGHSAFALGMAFLPHLKGLLQASAWYDGATPTAVVKEI